MLYEVITQKATGQVLGVHDCSLDVAEGEILVLMGLSGSGKSTLLRAVNALNPVCRGEVRIRDGHGLTSITHADRATLRRLRLNQVAMVFQQFGLLPWRTVRENVGLGLELAGMNKAERREKVDAQLELVITSYSIHYTKLYDELVRLHGHRADLYGGSGIDA